MYLIIKRAFDILAASAILIVIAPLLLPIMLGLKLTGEGYIFYMQERVGFHNRLFGIYKFATMLLNSPDMDGGIFTTKNDPRITPLGDFLRKTKINELPQLINIVRGEMSFVGPRPVMQKSFDQYPQAIKESIYKVRPGLTGIGSIVFRDEEDIISDWIEGGGDPWEIYSNYIYPYKGELEHWYQQNQSAWVDSVIVFCTAWVILFPSSDIVYRFLPSLPAQPEHEYGPA